MSGVRYVVSSQREGSEKVVLKSWTEACGHAVAGSLESQTAYVIDVYAQTRAGANRFGGTEAVRRYEDLGSEHPIERIEIRADSLGVP